MTNLSFEQALCHLEGGKIIAYPTETFYAVGGLALSEEAAIAVFNAKGRGTNSPLPIIIAGIHQLPLLAKNISEAQLSLAKKFWPGPLSILFEAGTLVPQALHCNTGQIAIRQTPHTGAMKLCEACGPLSASSANLSGEPAVKTPEQLSPALLEHLAGVVALPPEPAGGLASTLVQVLSDNSLKILRIGAIGLEKLSAAGWEISS